MISLYIAKLFRIYFLILNISEVHILSVFYPAIDYNIKKDVLDSYCSSNSAWKNFLQNAIANPNQSWWSGSSVSLGRCLIFAMDNTTSGIVSPYDTDTSIVFNKTDLKQNGKNLRILNPSSSRDLCSTDGISAKCTFFGNTSWKASLPYYKIKDKEIQGVMQGGLFEGELLTSLYSSAYFTNRDGKQQARHDYFDYNKYKVVRNNNYLSVYKYDISRKYDGTVDWVYDSTTNSYKILEDNPYSLNQTPIIRRYRSYFAGDVVPMQLLLLINGCGGSGAYRSIGSNSAGGGAGSFVMAWLDWNKIPTDAAGNKTFWIRVPHGADYSDRRRYNLSTCLNCYNEYSVDPVILSDGTLWSDSYNNTASPGNILYDDNEVKGSWAYDLNVFSGTNATYRGKGGLSQAVVLSNGNATSDSSGEAAEQNMYSIGYKAPFELVCSGRGGAAGEGAYYLYKYDLFSKDKKVMPKNLDLRSLSVESFKYLNAGTGGSLSGGASWFANGPAVNHSAAPDGSAQWGCGAGGKNTNTGDGLRGGSGVVQIFY